MGAKGWGKRSVDGSGGVWVGPGGCAGCMVRRGVMEMIRVGFVGVGNISRRHFNALGRMRDQAVVVAVCDVMEDRARTVAEELGAVAYTSSHQMLATERLDALYVCLPPDAHVDQELAAAAKGIHLFVEKPLPLDIDKAEAIARNVRKAGIVTAVGFHWRYFSHVRGLRDTLATERVGMATGSFMNLLPGTPWWRVASRSGGQVVEQAVHIFDTARFLLGDVETVQANYARRVLEDEPGFDQDDVHVVNIRFRSGVVASFAVTSILHRRWRVGLDIFCRNRVYRVRDDELEIDDQDGIRTVANTVDAGFAETDSFIKAILTGDRSGVLSDYDDALLTQRVVLGANLSARTGQVVHFP